MSTICWEVLTCLIWNPRSRYIRSNHGGSGDVSHGWPSAFEDHLDHNIVIFECKKRCPLAGDQCVWRNIINKYCLITYCPSWEISSFGFGVACRISLSAGGCNTPVTLSHKLSTGIPSYLKPASNEIISASVLLCETAVCFLQVHLIGTNVLLPNMHSTLPDVDVESVRSPAKSASWKRTYLYSDAVLPTW